MHDACRAISKRRARRRAGDRRRGHVRTCPGQTRSLPRPALLGQPAGRGDAVARPLRGGQAGRYRPRDAAWRGPAHTRLSVVRERPARRPRVGASTSTRPASGPCGPASARWPPPTPTRGFAPPAPPPRSSRRARTTGWSRSPTPSCARPTCRWTRGPATSCARRRPPVPPACPRSAGCSHCPGRTPTTTGSFRTDPSCTAPPPSGWPGRRRSSSPASASTTWRPSTSTRASPWWCRWRRPSSGSPLTTPAAR